MLTKELLPLPLRPQIPIFSPGLIDIVKLRRTRSELTEYEAETFANSIAPLVGQLSGGVSISLGRFSDAVWAEKLLSRAIAPKEVSRRVQFLII